MAHLKKQDKIHQHNFILEGNVDEQMLKESLLYLFLKQFNEYHVLHYLGCI